MTASINSLVELYGKYGDREYIGEDVTQMQHASQAAENAIRDGASVEVSQARLISIMYYAIVFSDCHWCAAA